MGLVKKKGKLAGRVKAGYIFSLLPQGLRSRLLGRLSRAQTERLNDGLGRSGGLAPPEKKRVLGEFITSMRRMEKERREIIDGSLAASLVLMAVIVLASFLYAQSVYRSAGAVIDFIELVLAGGGMHFILFPLVWGLIRSERGTSPLRLLASSDHPVYDVFLAAAAGLLMAALFVATNPAGPEAGLPLPARCLYAVAAVFVGPAMEELFFRYYLFMSMGGKYGYAACGIFSSLLFMAVHLPDTPLLFVRYLFSGILLCALCFFRKSLLPAFIAHAAANTAVLAA